jgi:hypothetical protein
MLLEGRTKVVVTPRWPSCILPLALFALAPGCVGSGRVTPTGATSATATSPTMLPLVYQEDGAVLFLGVDTRAAQYARDGETMFPLGVALGNRARRTLTLGRESFTLETQAGERLPLVSVAEFNRDYRRSSSDLDLARTFLDALQAKFDPQKFRARAFFPARGGTGTATAVDAFDLGTTEWTHLYLYFPMPADGVHDRRLELLVTVDGEPDPFLVSFEVR